MNVQNQQPPMAINGAKHVPLHPPTVSSWAAANRLPYLLPCFVAIVLTIVALSTPWLSIVSGSSRLDMYLSGCYSAEHSGVTVCFEAKVQLGLLIPGLILLAAAILADYLSQYPDSFPALATHRTAAYVLLMASASVVILAAWAHMLGETEQELTGGRPSNAYYGPGLWCAIAAFAAAIASTGAHLLINVYMRDVTTKAHGGNNFVQQSAAAGAGHNNGYVSGQPNAAMYAPQVGPAPQVVVQPAPYAHQPPAFQVATQPVATQPLVLQQAVAPNQQVTAGGMNYVLVPVQQQQQQPQQQQQQQQQQAPQIPPRSAAQQSATPIEGH